MKKTSKNSTNGKPDEMLPHYDFSGGVRGKHFKKFREGINIQLLESGEKAKLISLDEDLGNIFPDSKAVNDALRHIVEAMPKTRRKRAA